MDASSSSRGTPTIPLLEKVLVGERPLRSASRSLFQAASELRFADSCARRYCRRKSRRSSASFASFDNTAAAPPPPPLLPPPLVKEEEEGGSAEKDVVEVEVVEDTCSVSRSSAASASDSVWWMVAASSARAASVPPPDRLLRRAMSVVHYIHRMSAGGLLDGERSEVEGEWRGGGKRGGGLYFCVGVG